MATLRLRDRDAIITKEGLIFRVFGYSHTSNAYICDVEYAPSEIFRSSNPKAFRNQGQRVFYKFYDDEGLKFIEKHHPQYLLFHDMLRMKVVGVNYSDIVKVKKPDEKLKEIMKMKPQDELIEALHEALEFTAGYSCLSKENFGIFGSLLHDFYHPRFSDLDFIIYGREKAVKLREALQQLYEDRHSPLKNEFKNDELLKGKKWRFQNYSFKEFVWHQQRKMIYALFNDEKSGRTIKTEFEPVKDWEEIAVEHFSGMKIVQKGWVRMLACITEDEDALFIPSVYRIKPLKVLHGAKEAKEATRVVSYMEEFRLQAKEGEKVYVEGNLEQVATSDQSFYQIALTYCPRYYEQALKVRS